MAPAISQMFAGDEVGYEHLLLMFERFILGRLALTVNSRGKILPAESADAMKESEALEQASVLE